MDPNPIRDRQPDGGGAPTLERLAAFTSDQPGGNPAGVWIGPRLPPAPEMLRIAAQVGYSETAFLTGSGELERWTVRYFSPKKEIDFCGHATIASAVALGRRHGERTFRFDTPVGEVPVVVRRAGDSMTATLTSVDPRRRRVDDDVVDEVLRAMRWDRADLDPGLPVESAFAGAWHLVVPVTSREVLASLDYDFDELQRIMTDLDLTTVQVIWREDDHLIHSRNPFPVGGVVEDPATGAAAAALGGYLRQHHLVDVPADVVVLQGVDMGRPSRIDVHIPATGGIQVSGTAVDI